MARAFGWQPKGHRFDSDILHEPGSKPGFFYLYAFIYIPIHSNIKTDGNDEQLGYTAYKQHPDIMTGQ